VKEDEAKGAPRVAIIMRSFNDVAVIERTLQQVERQTYRNFELWNFDSTSTDGTLDIVRRHNVAERIRLNDSRHYNPGRVLNEAVAAAQADYVVFLNSDATPCDERWLERLIEPLQDPRVGAVFGRQMARPDCRPLFVRDTERAYGDGATARQWLHFFSMANAAARREVLVSTPLETCIQYSEDIDWSYRLRQRGLEIRYVAEASVTHSHNYSLRQSLKRHFGEGMAEAWIFRRGELRADFLRYCLGPFGMEVLRDLAWAFRSGSVDAALHSVPLRAVQKWGRWKGHRAGRRRYVGA
jgi:rhamnosyltransferase